ncbi:MAG: hypothetical protein PF541_14470 [Prolixibacteraceae bacterium]|nr:hypothetical protein [Prolixibacteraceae bacterium]
MKNAIAFLDQKNYYEVALIALHYYDKSYLKGMRMRINEGVVRIPLETTNHAANAILIEEINTNYERNKVN